MGKIIASYLIKVHVHEPDAGEGWDEGDLADSAQRLTNDLVKDGVIEGLEAMLPAGADKVTVSLIERTDSE